MYPEPTKMSLCATLTSPASQCSPPTDSKSQSTGPLRLYSASGQHASPSGPTVCPKSSLWRTLSSYLSISKLPNRASTATNPTTPTPPADTAATNTATTINTTRPQAAVGDCRSPPCALSIAMDTASIAAHAAQPDEHAPCAAATAHIMIDARRAARPRTRVLAHRGPASRSVGSPDSCDGGRLRRLIRRRPFPPPCHASRGRWGRHSDDAGTPACRRRQPRISAHQHSPTRRTWDPTTTPANDSRQPPQLPMRDPPSARMLLLQVTELGDPARSARP